MPDFDAQAMKRDDGREEVWRVASATSEDHARQIAVAVASREGGQHLVGRIEPARSKSPSRVLRPVDLGQATTEQADERPSSPGARVDPLERIAASPLVRQPVRTIARAILLAYAALLVLAVVLAFLWGMFAPAFGF